MFLKQYPYPGRYAEKVPCMFTLKHTRVGGHKREMPSAVQLDVDFELHGQHGIVIYPGFIFTPAVGALLNDVMRNTAYEITSTRGRDQSNLPVDGYLPSREQFQWYGYVRCYGIAEGVKRR
jgi:hypothetical protein